MKIAILARVSSIEQNTERQITELRSYAKERSFYIVDEIVETISGARRNSEREGIQRLLQLAQAGKISKVLVHEVSRLGRNTAQVLDTLEKLHNWKVSVVVKNYNLETLNGDGTPNAMAQFIFTLLADLGRMERIQLIERVRSGMYQAKRNGKHIGRPVGSTKQASDLLKEYNKVVSCLKGGYSIRNTAKICEVSISTVQRVKKLLYKAMDSSKKRQVT